MVELEEPAYPGDSHYLFPLEELDDEVADCLRCQNIFYDCRPCAACSLPMIEHTDDRRRLRHSRCQRETERNFHKLYQRARYHNEVTEGQRERIREEADALTSQETYADIVRMVKTKVTQMHYSSH